MKIDELSKDPALLMYLLLWSLLNVGTYHSHHQSISA